MIFTVFIPQNPPNGLDHTHLLSQKNAFADDQRSVSRWRRQISVFANYPTNVKIEVTI